MQNKHSKAGKFAGKGYYIALILCAAAIGISGYLYYRNETAEPPALENPSQTVDVMNPGTSVPETDPTLPSPGTTGPGKPVPQPLQTGRPVTGQVLLDYAMDCLCYNPTTRDWRTHDGMDLAAEAGSPVKAAAAGTVYTVYSDETMGMTVVIRHEDGYMTTYSSLSAEVPVAAGDRVSLGQTVGYVGSSALLESALGDHVHFAVTCNGKSVDPELFWAIS